MQSKAVIPNLYQSYRSVLLGTDASFNSSKHVGFTGGPESTAGVTALSNGHISERGHKGTF